MRIGKKNGVEMDKLIKELLGELKIVVNIILKMRKNVE